MVVTGSSALGDWLRQALAAAGFGAAFAVAAVVLAQAEPVPLEVPEPEARAGRTVPAATTAAEPSTERRRRSPPTAAPAAPAPHVSTPPLTAQAQQIYSRRLAFSPRAAEARQLVDDVARLESDGQAAEAVRLIDRLQAM